MDEGVGLFVQVVLTTPQAQLLAAVTAGAAEEGGGTNQKVRDELYQLATFFSYVAESPRSFPVRGQMAKSIKTRMRNLRRAQSYQG